MLDAKADTVTVTISDAAGNTVATEQLGARDAGSFAFAWDGKNTDGTTAADGSYSFKVSASNGGQPVTASTLTAASVNAVVLSSGGFQLDLGSSGKVKYSDVKQIL
jgi:flagellar basal-body rod modification protein FlgD